MSRTVLLGALGAGLVAAAAFGRRRGSTVTELRGLRAEVRDLLHEARLANEIAGRGHVLAMQAFAGADIPEAGQIERA